MDDTVFSHFSRNFKKILIGRPKSKSTRFNRPDRPECRRISGEQIRHKTAADRTEAQAHHGMTAGS